MFLLTLEINKRHKTSIDSDSKMNRIIIINQNNDPKLIRYKYKNCI